MNALSDSEPLLCPIVSPFRPQGIVTEGLSNNPASHAHPSGPGTSLLFLLASPWATLVHVTRGWGRGHSASFFFIWGRHGGKAIAERLDQGVGGWAPS